MFQTYIWQLLLLRLGKLFLQRGHMINILDFAGQAASDETAKAAPRNM